VGASAFFTSATGGAPSAGVGLGSSAFIDDMNDAVASLGDWVSVGIIWYYSFFICIQINHHKMPTWNSLWENIETLRATNFSRIIVNLKF
jgi:hypothetical protein